VRAVQVGDRKYPTYTNQGGLDVKGANDAEIKIIEDLGRKDLVGGTVYVYATRPVCTGCQQAANSFTQDTGVRIIFVSPVGNAPGNVPANPPRR
jgi:hypothetical protein